MLQKERNFSQKDYLSLSPNEREIFDMMMPRNGVVMLQGKPGIGKTAIVKSIAKKLNFQFFEFALTHIDAADLGGLPVIKHVDGIPQMTYAVNDWALQANERPTILFFDEANRPTEEVINALLKLFEGHIGLNFKFNENVYMIAAGNLGMDEDGTTVTALDSAMNNRIIHVPFTMTVETWVRDFASKHVHPLIVSFVEGHKDHLHKFVKGQDIYASPRSWTMFSDYILTHDRKTPKEVRQYAYRHITKYIGAHSGAAFKSYVDELLSARIPDMKEIVSKGSKLEEDLRKLNFSQLSYIVNSFEIEHVKGAGEKELSTFMSLLTDDQITTMYARIITNVVKSNLSPDDPNYISQDEMIRPYKPALRVYKDIAQSLIKA